jgi:uncharacterized LabA/DUF88 family protein/cold shock CspA family protein
MDNNRFLRIGVFVDGGYLNHISNYYRFGHARQARISMTGLKAFIRQQVARVENAEMRLCQIVDAHYYRGRLSAAESEARNQLLTDRRFDEVLAFAGFESHYQPVAGGKEKGVDVHLALDAFQHCTSRNLDVCVLVTGDSDFVPLVRNLHSYGTRVMVLGWNVSMTDELGVEQETRCSFYLLQESTHPIHVHDIVDQTPEGEDSILENLFFKSAAQQVASDLKPAEVVHREPAPPAAPTSTAVRSSGIISHLQDNFGFILRSSDSEQFFFHASDLVACRYFEIGVDDNVSFEASSNERGACARSVQRS